MLTCTDVGSGLKNDCQQKLGLQSGILLKGFRDVDKKQTMHNERHCS